MAYCRALSWVQNRLTVATSPRNAPIGWEPSPGRLENQRRPGEIRFGPAKFDSTQRDRDCNFETSPRKTFALGKSALLDRVCAVAPQTCVISSLKCTNKRFRYRFFHETYQAQACDVYIKRFYSTFSIFLSIVLRKNPACNPHWSFVDTFRGFFDI